MTAVDILWDMIPKDTQNYIVKQFNGLEKAKEMEKEQIIDALLFGDVLSPNTAENYYKERFGGNK
jgi:hypothetical protein